MKDADGEVADDEPFSLVLDSQDHGERLDKVLARRLAEVSRACLQRWLASGRITADGVVADRRTRAREGATVLVRPEPPLPYSAEPEDIPLRVLFEDPDLLVLDKPAGLVVHPAPGHPRGTLVNALLHHVSLAGGEAHRPGIVHRLDKDTSGVMVVAKSSVAHERLVAAFAAHDLDREYVALASGAIAADVTFDTFHDRHPTDRKRFTSRTARGRRAVTHVRVLEALEGSTAVSCRLETGRTHQIRVHLADAGHPLLGDPLYGKPPADARARAVAADLARQALHAGVLGFAHPRSGVPLRFEAPPPADFARARDALRRPAP